MSSDRVNQKLIKEIDAKQKEKKKGWTNIADAESTLVNLELQYNKAKDALTRSQIIKLIDVYEKQVKALNLSKLKRKTNNRSTEPLIYTINEESESEKSDDEK